MSDSNLQLARRYLAALERGDVQEVLACLDPAIVQEEFPNRLAPHGATRDLAALRAGAEHGRQLLATQRYEIQSAVVDGDRVALEVRWTGRLAVPLAGLAAGDEMRARFAVFLDFAAGLIVRQRNYDCFEPW